MTVALSHITGYVDQGCFISRVVSTFLLAEHLHHLLEEFIYLTLGPFLCLAQIADSSCGRFPQGSWLTGPSCLT